MIDQRREWKRRLDCNEINSSEHEGARITSFAVEFPELPPLDGLVVGIDPGQVNMGLAVLRRVGLDAPHLSGLAYQLKLPAETDMVARIITTFNLVEHLLLPWQGPDLACVENAAYQAVYGQAALAENRTAAVLALLKRGAREIVVPAPMQIRKEVFGNGKTKAEEVWPDLAAEDKKGQIHHDAASALACALYARLLYLERSKDVTTV